MSSDKPLKPVSSEQAAFDFGVKLARGEQGVPGGAAKEEGATETKGGEGAVEDPHGLAQKIERFDPNKLLKKDGGITSDPKECDEVGYPYNLVGSGASPQHEEYPLDTKSCPNSTTPCLEPVPSVLA